MLHVQALRLFSLCACVILGLTQDTNYFRFFSSPSEQQQQQTPQYSFPGPVPTRSPYQDPFGFPEFFNQPFPFQAGPYYHPSYRQQFYSTNPPALPAAQPFTLPSFASSPFLNQQQQQFFRAFSTVPRLSLPDYASPGVRPTENTTSDEIIASTTVSPLTTTQSVGPASSQVEPLVPTRPGVTRTVLVDRLPNLSMYFRRPTQNIGVDFGRPVHYQFIYPSQLRDAPRVENMNDVLSSRRASVGAVTQLTTVSPVPANPLVVSIPSPPVVPVKTPAASSVVVVRKVVKTTSTTNGMSFTTEAASTTTAENKQETSEPSTSQETSTSTSMDTVTTKSS